ncbi:3-hydroxyisobutyrate dehydrogenase [Linderina pennispora]|uniref:3-hydroxyisobutyrate dehydrogenase n=1 Tax=Linderina pennispora TaxID=61395 RepID=A0A1Y1WHN1_9FUNG|nr:3-hydroxyisobutyrate dehydrogenase [Linderina pennispora]ORX72746.1 3-hydroxyisobutyrate dehydrogenase [Linderina pennispora]
MLSSTLRTPVPRLARPLLARQYSSSAPTIGFIGLGQMGYNMATHLCTKSQSPFVDTVAKFQDENANATAASSPADLADKASVIVTVLPESAHVRSVYLGNNGVRDGLRKNTLCIDSSTIDTSVSIDVSRQLIGLGARAVDAPISGGIMGAKAGTLTFMVGSENAQDYDAAKVYLERMGKNVVRCGDLGAGQAAKICNNLLLAISMVGTAEALNLGVRLGLDPSVLAGIINTSSGRCWSSDTSNPVPDVLPNAPSTNGYNGGFKSKLMLKDLGLVANAAKDSKTPLMLGGLVESIYRHLSNQGDMAEKDFSVVYKWLAESQK